MINIHILSKKFVWIIVLLLINFAQLSVYSNQANSKRVHFIQTAEEPENRGAPDDRKGAGTRSNSSPTNKPLTELEPMTKASCSKYVLGMTEAEHPTF